MKTTYLKWPKSTWYVYVVFDEDNKWHHVEVMHVGDPERRALDADALSAISDEGLRIQFEVAAESDTEIQELQAALTQLALDYGVRKVDAPVAVSVPVVAAAAPGLDLPEVW